MAVFLFLNLLSSQLRNSLDGLPDYLTSLKPFLTIHSQLSNHDIFNGFF